MNIIDLFSGCGELSLGFIKDGHTIIKALEYDPEIAKTYKMNHPEIEVIVKDIREVDNPTYFSNGSADIIIGGPPCQGFFMAGARIRGGFIDDPRNYLFKHYFNIVRMVKPKAFVIENVKGIQSMQNGKVFAEILRIFSSSDLLCGKAYNIYYRTIKAVEFGIPQKRERMIIIGVQKEGIDFDDLWDKTRQQIADEDSSFFEQVTVQDAILNMPKPSEDGCVDNIPPITNYQKYLYHRAKKLHNHIRRNIVMLQLIE